MKTHLFIIRIDKNKKNTIANILTKVEILKDKLEIKEIDFLSSEINEIEKAQAIIFIGDHYPKKNFSQNKKEHLEIYYKLKNILKKINYNNNISNRGYKTKIMLDFIPKLSDLQVDIFNNLEIHRFKFNRLILNKPDDSNSIITSGLKHLSLFEAHQFYSLKYPLSFRKSTNYYNHKSHNGNKNNNNDKNHYNKVSYNPYNPDNLDNRYNPDNLDNPYNSNNSKNTLNRDCFINYIVSGRVVGVNHAKYGLPKEIHPILIANSNILQTRTLFSNFDIMEFRPKQRWAHLWCNIISYLLENNLDKEDIEKLNNVILEKYKPIIFIKENYATKTSNKNNSFEDNEKRNFINVLIKGYDWFKNSGVLLGENNNAEEGVAEGFTSEFDIYGKKTFTINPFRKNVITKRADCTMDVAYAFFRINKVLNNPINSNVLQEKKLIIEKNSKIIHENLIKEIINYWQHWYQKEKNNISNTFYPNSNCISSKESNMAQLKTKNDTDNSEIRKMIHGFFGWFNDEKNLNVFYADDNGRVTLQLLWLSVETNDDILIERAINAAIALIQTHGKNGHRFRRLETNKIIKKKGREWFAKHNTKRHEYSSPHYEGWTLATIAYAGWLINDPNVLNIVEKGLKDYAKRFPKIHVEHSINDDFSKLLIASVILYGATKSEFSLQFSKRIIKELLKIYDSQIGAFPERDPYNKHARKERKNCDYGKGEAALYSSNEDTITDQLYSTPFIAWAFHLANKLDILETNGEKKVEKRILKYLMDIQIKSDNLQLNGAWMRAFDYTLGEYYGSNGDVGWGAYSIETGWMVAPILTAFAWYIEDWSPFDERWIQPNVKSKIEKNYQLLKSFKR